MPANSINKAIRVDITVKGEFQISKINGKERNWAIETLQGIHDYQLSKRPGRCNQRRIKFRPFDRRFSQFIGEIQLFFINGERYFD